MIDTNDFISDFIDEANEILEQLEQQLFQLERGEMDKELMDSIFRSAHTLKGSAAFLGLKNINRVTHEMETIFDKLKKDKLDIGEQVISILFEGLDYIKEMLDQVIEDGHDNLNIDDIVGKLRQIYKKNEKSINQVEMDNEENSEPKINIHNTIDEAIAKNEDKVFFLFSDSLEIEREYGLALEIEEIDQNIVEFLFENEEEEEKDNICKVFDKIFNSKLGKQRKSIYLSLLPGYTKKSDQVFNLEYNLIENNKDIKILVVLAGIDKNNLINKAAQETVSDEFVSQEKPIERLKDDDDENKENHILNNKIKNLKLIRVDTKRIDYIMNLVGELVTGRNRLFQVTSQFESTELRNSVNFIGNLTTDLQAAIMKMRMVPLKKTFNKFPRVVRDLSKQLGKEIKLVIKGEGTELDRIVTDEIYEPLVHLIRNAVDHGIELPNEREKMGKKREGILKIDARQEDNFVYIEISDDGGGIDPKRVIAKALGKEIITEIEATNLTRDEAVKLIFKSGFSTSETLSDISGRGVGMDVVKNKIEELDGIVDIVTEKGEGSSFMIRLPLTLAIMKVLIIKVANRKYAIPLNSVVESIRINKGSIETVSENEIIFLRGKPLPIVYLSSVFNIKEFEKVSKKLNIVVLGAGEKRIGLVIDDMLGKQEIVIKPMGKYLGKVKGVSGATILGDGSIIMIIDSNLVVNQGRSLANQAKLLKKELDIQKLKILCIDDSRSVQKMLGNFFSKNGFDVDTSENGSMALRKVVNIRYDLIITDYSMPRMNGYEFIKNLRKIRGYKFSPVILLTSSNKGDIPENIDSLNSVTFSKKPIDFEKLLELVKNEIK